MLSSRRQALRAGEAAAVHWGLNTMQRMLLLGKEISFRASISYFHISDMVLSLYLSQILVGVIKQRLDMKLLN